MMPHSCRHCRAVLINSLYTSLGGTEHARLHQTPREALQAAKDGCLLFQLLIKGYLKALSDYHIREYTGMLFNQFTINADQDWGLDYMAGVVSQLALNASKTPFRMRLNYDAMTRFTADFQILNWASQVLFISTTVDDVAATFIPVREINLEVGSDRAFRTAKGWLNECMDGNPKDIHHHCVPPSLVFTPTRLLKISNTNENFAVKLHLTRTNEKLQYCSLSYCWGGDQPLKTTKSTYASNLRGIDYHKLPRTLQDAITVTSRLGLQYIWIDCLCIVQDDPDDLARELSKMPDIYTYGLVTISAASSKSCHEGFLHDRKSPYSLELELRYMFPNKVEGRIRLSQDKPWERLTYRDVENPIDSRAWTYQERALSPRVLEYGTRQLLWQCRTKIRYDGGMHDKTRNRRSPELASLLGSKLDGENTTQTVIDEWSGSVNEYTKRDLSFPGDKLIACAAVAQRIGELYGLTYLAGLWMEGLVIQLRWRLTHDPVKRPSLYRAPSWSWASVDGGVGIPHGFPGSREGRVQLEILECKTVAVREDLPYGAVTAGWLTVRGCIKNGKWFFNREDNDAIVFDDSDEEEETNEDEYGEDESDGELQADAEDHEFDPEVFEQELFDEQNLDSHYMDAIEDWYSPDQNAFIEAAFLQVFGQGDMAGAGSKGIILVPCEPCDGMRNKFQRVGWFSLGARAVSPFETAEEEIITIV